MDLDKLQADLRKTRRQLLLLYEIGNLMRTTLKLDETIFLILSAITSHEGLGINRAILFLTDDTRSEIRGVFGIGPWNPSESAVIWKEIDEKKLQLEGFIDVYRKSKGAIDPELNRLVQTLRIPYWDRESIIARTTREGVPFVAMSDEVRHGLKDGSLELLNIRYFVCVPLKGKEQVIGAVLADNIATKKHITKEEVLTLSMLADHGGLAIENATVYGRVLETSQKDSLTQLWNHAHFQEILLQSMQMAKLQNSPLSLVIFDVDDFKKFNDERGHPEGDRALQVIAHVARSSLRRTDTIARYGGEEFAMILPGTGREEAYQLTEKLRREIEKQSLEISPRPIRISGGISTFPGDAEDREKLIFCADAALYEAKRSGKNRIRMYQKI